MKTATKAKKTKGERAIELVKKWLGVDPRHDGRKYVAHYKDQVLEWGYDEERDRIELVHSRRADDLPDSYTDYFPGMFHDTIDEAVKSLATTYRREDTGDEYRAVLGWYGAASVTLGFKPGAGFVRQANIQVTRFVYCPEAFVTSQFRHETFVLHDAQAIAFAEAFIAGEMPLGPLLDWLMDRDEAGMPQIRPHGRQPKSPPVVAGRLKRFLALPAGHMRGEVVPSARTGASS